MDRPSATSLIALGMIGLGILLGQGLEPLGEVIYFRAGWDVFTNVARWRIFAEFLGAGLVTWFVTQAFGGRIGRWGTR